MCGIIGIISNSNVTDKIIKALKKLEYRGYDSAGIATINNQQVSIVKAAGKIVNLEHALKQSSQINGNIGIGHTRWATHGIPSEKNAHPFMVDSIAVVHNGIIENYLALRKMLIKAGYFFHSDTDTEVVPNLFSYFMRKGLNEIEAAKQVKAHLEGAFALAIIFGNNPDIIIGIKNGAPLAIGIAEDEMFLGSDAVALSDFSNKIVYLKDGDISIIERESYKIINHSNEDVTLRRKIKIVSNDYNHYEKGNFEHFMRKEIFEQPKVLIESFNKLFNHELNKFNFDSLNIDWLQIKRIYIIACGTSFNAALTAKYWFEKHTSIPVEVDIASEARYRNGIYEENSVAIFISQSGETADTIASLNHIKNQRIITIGIINVLESTIANIANHKIMINAGVEIGVASTKAFTCQLLSLASLCLYVASCKKILTSEELASFIYSLHELPASINEILTSENIIKDWAKFLKNAKSIIYTARGTLYPLSLEGALKIKELSYIHSEGIAAGELKHGSIALIDENLPVIAVAPSNELYNKLSSNICEIYARKGKVYSLTDAKGLAELSDLSFQIMKMPNTNDFTAPILYSIPLQLLAYYTALELGKDIDQPRNLAKSVTVE